MDEADRRLIATLRGDARMALSDLALALGLSRATVRARLEKLRASGEIVGFTVVTRSDVARDPVRALMMIGIEGRGTERVLRQLQGLPGVNRVRRCDTVGRCQTPKIEAGTNL